MGIFHLSFPSEHFFLLWIFLLFTCCSLDDPLPDTYQHNFRSLTAVIHRIGNQLISVGNGVIWNDYYILTTTTVVKFVSDDNYLQVQIGHAFTNWDWDSKGIVDSSPSMINNLTAHLALINLRWPIERDINEVHRSSRCVCEPESIYMYDPSRCRILNFGHVKHPNGELSNLFKGVCDRPVQPYDGSEKTFHYTRPDRHVQVQWPYDGESNCTTTLIGGALICELRTGATLEPTYTLVGLVEEVKVEDKLWLAAVALVHPQLRAINKAAGENENGQLLSVKPPMRRTRPGDALPPTLQPDASSAAGHSFILGTFACVLLSLLYNYLL